MKKALSVIIVLSVLFSVSALAFAEFDLSALTDEELMQLPLKVTEEQIARGLVKSAHIGSGKYIVGQDLPAGNYKATNEHKYSMNFWVFDKNGRPTYNLALWETGEETGKIILNDGDTLEINGSILLSVFSGIVWE